MDKMGNDCNREFILEQPVGLGIDALAIEAALGDLIANWDGFHAIALLPKPRGEHPEAKFIVDIGLKPPSASVGEKATKKRIGAKQINPDEMIGFSKGKVIITEKGKERLEKTIFHHNGKYFTPDQMLKSRNIPGGVKDLQTVTREEFLEHYRTYLLALQILQPKKKNKTTEAPDHVKTGSSHNYGNEKITNKTEMILLDKRENLSHFKLISLQMSKIAEDLWKIKERNAKVSKEAAQESTALAKDDARHHDKVLETNKDEQGKKITSSRQEQANMSPKKEIAASKDTIEKSLEAEQHNVSPAPPQEP